MFVKSCASFVRRITSQVSLPMKLIPDAVRGMIVFNKDAFRNTVKLPVVRCPTDRYVFFMRNGLKSHWLTTRALKRVRDDPHDKVRSIPHIQTYSVGSRDVYSQTRANGDRPVTCETGKEKKMSERSKAISHTVHNEK